MLLDSSYFDGNKYNVAQLGHLYVRNRFTTFIAEWEPMILTAALGYELSMAFTDGLDVGSGEAIEQRWIDLRDGKMFVNRYSRKDVWMGFANNEKKLSASAGMIYSKWLEDQSQIVTASGTKKSDSENASNTNDELKVRLAWQETVNAMKVLWEFLRVNPSVYPEFNISQVDHCFFGNKNLFGI